MDSTRFYFNSKENADSIISYSDGLVINKLTFEYSKGRLTKKEFKGQMRGQIMNMTWTKSYKSDTVLTTLRKGSEIIRTDTSIIHKSNNVETIILKTQTIVHTYSPIGLKIKTEIFKNEAPITTNNYEYDYQNQLIKIIRTWPNDSGSSTDQFQLTFDDRKNWIERVKYNVVGFEKQMLPTKTVRKIKY